MPNAQQIALNLVAQLDQGNIQSQASQMASTMARAIESAFEGLGEKIAATIVAGVRQGLRGSVELIGATSTQEQLIATARAGGQNVPAPGEFPGGAPGAAPMAPMPQSMNAAMYFTQGGYMSPGVMAPPPEPTPRQDARTIFGIPRKTAIAGMGAISAGLEAYGELPGIRRGAMASEAEISEMPGRALLRGDIEGAFVQQQLGGTEAMRGKATREEWGKMGAEIGAAIVGVMAAPVTGGLSLIGSVTAGLDVARRVSGFSSQVEGNMQEQVEAERKRQFGFLEATGAGRNVGIQSFRAAQGLGIPEMAPFIGGGMPSGAGGSMREFANAQGVSPEAFQQAMTSMAGLPGGIGIQNNNEAVRRMLGNIGQGFSGGPQVAAGFAAGGAGGEEALTRASSVFEEAVAAGLDKAQLGQSLMRMSQQSEAMGLGGAGLAQRNMEFAMSLAQQMHGGRTGDISGAEMRMAEESSAHFRTQGADLQGPAFVARIQALRRLERQRNIHLSAAQELQLARFQADPEGLRTMAGERGTNARTRQFLMGQMQGHDPLAEIQEARIGGTERELRRINPQQRILETLSRPADSALSAAQMFSQAGTRIAGGQVPATPGVRVDPTRAMPSPETMAATEQMKQATILSASADATKVTEGLKSLAQQIPALIEAVKSATASFKQKANPGTTGGIMDVLNPLFNRSSSPGGG